MSTISCYIAAPWVHREAAKTAAQQFRNAGIDVVSRWIDCDGPDVPDTKHLKAEAIRDLEDLYSADGVVVLQLEKSEGKAFEQGFFLGISKHYDKRNKIVLVSVDETRGNVFQHINELYTLVPTVEAAIVKVLTWHPTASV